MQTISNTATERAEMPAGTSRILDRRTLENDNTNLLKFLRGDMHVLDVGCGSGSITAGIANYLRPAGMVTGIDVSEHLIATAKEHYNSIQNLRFYVADVNHFNHDGRFDLITSARVLQWLQNPQETILRMRGLLKRGGCLSVLDYNHTKIEWSPKPPKAMLLFYDAFLQWRADAGFDNEIADNLRSIFSGCGFRNIDVEEQFETTEHGDPHFEQKIGIWKDVAETRGHQLVKDSYITEKQRLAAINEYEAWIKHDAGWMKLYLLATEAKLE